MIFLENYSKLGVKENNNIYVILMNSLGSIIRLFYFALDRRLPLVCLYSGYGHGIKITA